MLRLASLIARRGPPAGTASARATAGVTSSATTLGRDWVPGDATGRRRRGGSSGENRYSSARHSHWTRSYSADAAGGGASTDDSGGSRRRRRLGQLAVGVAALYFGYMGYHKLVDDAEEPLPAPEDRLPLEKIPSREAQLARIDGGEFDILVIGGGASGAGVAADAVTRGLSVALLERDDFCSGTSSRSTKLIHGGVRYLEMAVKQLDRKQLHLVYDALYERSTLLKIAPHLCKPLPIMLPVYQHWWQVPWFWLGLKAYDVVAGSRALHPARYLTPQESLQHFPILRRKGLVGSVLYYDGQFNDARMCIDLVMTAASHGAATCNYLEVLSLLKDAAGTVCGVVARDRLSGRQVEVRARVVVNATGAYADSVRHMDDPQALDMIVPSLGTHVVLPDYYSPQNCGLLIPKTRDGRVQFLLPWEGNTIAGTTDTLTGIDDMPRPSEAEVEFVMDALADYLEVRPLPGEISATWSGLRPLCRDFSGGQTTTAKLSRDHVIEVSGSGLLTLAGGKWTTYRKMAQDAVDRSLTLHAGLAAKARRCITADIPLVGGENFDRILYARVAQRCNLPQPTAQHLAHNYGSNAWAVAALAITEKLLLPLSPDYPFLEAEVVYAARHEYARTAVDVLARRTRLAFLNTQEARSALPRVLELLAAELHWSPAQVAQERLRAELFLDSFQVPSTAAHAAVRQQQQQARL